MGVKKIGAVTLLLGLSAGFIFWQHQKVQQNTKEPAQKAATTRPAQPEPFDKSLYSNDKSDSLWAIVNKGRQLPSGYTPSDLVTPNIPLRLTAGTNEMSLRQPAAQALEQMAKSAKQNNADLMLASGYRSYNEQQTIYANEVKNFGQTQADRESAQPGHSEHQTGLAADLEPVDRSCEISDCFATTPAGIWLAANAYKYGYIIRYQKNAESLTGYRYEPWHVRYVGTALAGELNKSGQTMEQFFALPAYTNYPVTSFQLKP